MITLARERQLARRAAEGDRQAVKYLYEAYSEQLYSVARRVTESSTDARDVIHDVFCQLPKAIQSFDPQRSLGPWLRSVTTRAALKHLRSERRRRETIASISHEIELGTSPEYPVLNSITVERLLSSLPEKLRLVVILKEIEGYSHAEIAELLEVSRSASEGWLWKARELLRAELLER